MWGPFEIVIRETFTSTLNCLAGCDANPEVPDIETPEHTGPISVTKSPPPPGSPPNTPDKVVILTNGKEYEYDPDSPPPASEVFTKQPTTPTTFPAELKPPDPNNPDKSKLHLVTSTTMADVDDDGHLDIIATFKGEPSDPNDPTKPDKPGTTKVYLNPKTDPNSDAPDDFTGVTPIEIEAPDKDTSDDEAPATTSVVVAKIDDDVYPDIVTVNDAGENVLYFGGPTGPKLNEGKILGTDLTYDATTTPTTYTGNEDDPNVITERKSPSQSVQVADVDGDGRNDIVVANFPTPDPNDPDITDMTPNVVYFQDANGEYP